MYLAVSAARAHLLAAMDGNTSHIGDVQDAQLRTDSELGDFI
jgi:hypothetical protein